MAKIKYLPYVTLIIGLLFISFFLLFIKFLCAQDMKIDYSNKKIKYWVKDINGIDYLVVPYFFWQRGKLNEIKKRFSTSIVIGNENYIIDITYPDQEHEKTSCDLFPFWIYRDFKAKILKSRITNTNYGNINNTFISGNDNLVEIHQENNDKISSEIEKVISNESFNDMDKVFLELFKYKLNDKSAKKEDADRAVDILAKALPLTTAVIDLIKLIFFA
ncbi:MAG: hypothetical protein KH009_04445 [Clostridiales bacterium]|nr:hypothetical protein [Clostridiales bacterium]